MPAMRFNHMELTLPLGALERDRDAIVDFYGEVFGFIAIDVPLFESTGLLLGTDDEVSQFLLLMEQEEHLQSPGYDHLGFLYESRAEVDDIMAKCKQWQSKDDRLRLKEYDDLVISPTTTRAFYLQYLLPIWFDIQTIEYDEGTKPKKSWVYR